MMVQQLENCRFSSWYPQFRTQTIKSKIIPLPQEFVDYLFSDGVFQHAEEAPTYADADSDYSDTEEWANREEDDDVGSEPPTFPELEQQIKEVLSEYGTVFPKLNWSSPRDAVWITSTGTLECRTVSDIFLLLKSSDFIVHDMEYAYRECEDSNGQVSPTTFELVLRKWAGIQPSMEFRCFVRDNTLVAITQRNPTVYFPFLAERQTEIHDRVLTFFNDTITGNFPDSCYVFDVYLEPTGDVCLIDFNPFADMTEPGLFTWEELNEPLEGPLPEMRVVETNAGIQPSPLAYARMPRDIVDLSTGEDIHKFVDLFQQQKLGEGGGGEGSDDDVGGDKGEK